MVLREKAVTDPRAAEILLRWLQRPRQDNPPGVELDAMSEVQLERLHAGLAGGPDGRTDVDLC